jgi:hypothetical protein
MCSVETVADQSAQQLSAVARIVGFFVGPVVVGGHISAYVLWLPAAAAMTCAC